MWPKPQPVDPQAWQGWARGPGGRWHLVCCACAEEVCRVALEEWRPPPGWRKAVVVSRVVLPRGEVPAGGVRGS